MSRAGVALDALLAEPSAPRLELAYIEARGGDTNAGGYSGFTQCLCCAYGALRRSGESGLDTSDPATSGASLFGDDHALGSASDWYLRTDYAARSASGGDAAARLAQVKSTLIALLPDVEDLRVAGLDAPMPRPHVEALTPYGWVPMRSLGLGYRSMIAWVVDLAARMFEAYPTAEDPLAGPAIVLVDEIDLHLHPRWQREITSYLDQRFPNVQFVVTAHSSCRARA